MWPTPEGERVLGGAEWAAFRRGLRRAWRAAERALAAGRPARLGVAAFDGLAPAGQVALLAAVGAALSDPAAVPPAGAEAEAAVAAVYAVVGRRVQAEVWDEGTGRRVRRGWRRVVARAARACGVVRWRAGPPGDDPVEWEAMVDGLAGRVLWDRDFELAGGFLDADPAAAAPKRAVLGIAADYFTAAPPDPDAAALAAARATLARLTARGAE
jgi:hypothetical protein